MHKTRTVILGCVFLPALALAQSAFDGTWRPDPQTPTHEKPEVAVLRMDEYECQSCTPPYKVKVDGHEQPVAGNPYFDTITISIIHDRSIAKTAKKAAHGALIHREVRRYPSALPR